MNTEIEEDILIEDLTTSGETAYLIVYNDDHNTFDWVIECLMDVCKHSQQQSEQLSMIVHYNGKATVKTAPFEVVKPMKDALIDRGLSVVIETVAV